MHETKPTATRLPGLRARPQQKPPMTQPKSKLKCLVLGASSAGKTSMLRRYFYGNFESDRVPTLGSDFYTKRLPLPVSVTEDSNETKQETSISLQLWDTPGRERLDAKRAQSNYNQQQQQVPSLQASFLQQADAYMLVYDVTSSTSFKQLLKWYADLVQLLESASPADKSKSSSSSTSSLPILIVGTKMDLLQRDTSGSRLLNEQSTKRRSVLGLSDRDWKGRNYHYEYQVSKASDAQHEHDDNVPTRPDATKRMEIASYLADRENWTTDWGYLDSLLSSEDGSHPDRDMVVLWCGRNDLPHMEASAATGEGVVPAIEALVKLAMQRKGSQEGETQAALSSKEAPLATVLRHNKTLDLHQRYAPKDERCCFCWLRPHHRR